MNDRTVSVLGLRVEQFDGCPLSVHTSAPRLSWRTETAIADWEQAGWELEAVDAEGKPLWTSGHQEGRGSVLVPWGGAPLPSRTRCTWRVRVRGVDGSESEWSDEAGFEVGLLDPADWTAVAIGAAWKEDPSQSQPCPHLRTSFHLEGTPVRARLHATAHGIYQAAVNGKAVSDERLAPLWTAYEDRLYVQTYDVTDHVQRGVNTLSGVLADGWWRGFLGWVESRCFYGEELALLAQLEVDLDDGSTVTIGTDGSWEAATGPFLVSDFYNGETYDARIDPGPWSPVKTVDAFDIGRLVPQPTPPVRVTEIVQPVAITTSPAGNTIVDFGQNLVGVVRFRVRGEAGTEITLRHAEILEEDELCTRILRTAKATDRYTLRGDGLEEWSPTFTTHGFRYAEVSGWPGELAVSDIEALVMHSDMTRTGWFECSNELVNKLHQNIVWGWRGNTVAVPTDCPQRDERLGWTGDIQVFTPTASFLYDTAGFLGGWLRDLEADQLPNGSVPSVIPDALRMAIFGCGWGDAATVVPTELHQWYGDRAVLEVQLESMTKWVDSIVERTGERLVWDNDFQFGDWVDPTVDPNSPASARTDPGFVATAYFAHSADLVARAGALLGRDDVTEKYTRLAAEVRAAFRRQYVAPSGRVVADTQTGCAIALLFDMVEDSHREIVGARLQKLVQNELHRLSTGFLGTPLLNPALTTVGHVDDAYGTLLQTEAPSWLYPVTAGATTIWERWEALQPDGKLSAGAGMLSFNHYALGAIGQWLHSAVGGLSSVEPGFARFRVAPLLGPGITSATTTYDSRHGRIEVRWSLAGGGVEVHLTVPPNTRAEVVLPERDGSVLEVGSGQHRWQYGIDEERYSHLVSSCP